MREVPKGSQRHWPSVIACCEWSRGEAMTLGWCQQHGPNLTVSEEPETFEASILRAPKLKFAGDRDASVRNGSWNLLGARFARCDCARLVTAKWLSDCVLARHSCVAVPLI